MYLSARSNQGNTVLMKFQSENIHLVFKLKIWIIQIELYPYRNDKVVTTLSPPWHNLGTTLYFKSVARLLQGGGKAVTKVLSQPCIMKL